MRHQPRQRRFVAALTLLTCSGLAPAWAADLDCQRRQTSAEVERCAHLDKERADATLNASYQRLLGRVQHQYQASPVLEQEFLGKLKNAQRAWIKYRDTNCVVEAFEVQPGMPAHTTLINACVARLSQERARDMDQTLPECCS